MEEAIARGERWVDLVAHAVNTAFQYLSEAFWVRLFLFTNKSNPKYENRFAWEGGDQTRYKVPVATFLAKLDRLRLDQVYGQY